MLGSVDRLQGLFQNKMAKKKAPVEFARGEKGLGRVQVVPGAFKPIVDLFIWFHAATT